MQLVRFSVREGGLSRLGVLTPLGIVDAASCWQLHHLARQEEAPPAPASPLEVVRGGRAVMARLREASEWVLGAGGKATVLFNPQQVRLLAPIERPGKVVCVGKNYRDHCEEQGEAPPEQPLIFAKFSGCVVGSGAPVPHPRVTRKMDYEAELAVVVGEGGKRIPEAEALAHVGGYMNLNDFTARDLQRSDGQWVRAKACDAFCPTGPCLVTADAVADPQNLRIQCRVNGETVQDSNTGRMIFGVARLIAHISEFTTLEPGDVIATGTPHGVGHWRKPPVYLKPGDRVEVEVEGLGCLSNPIVAEA